MKKPGAFLMAVIFCSLSCQFLAPARDGMIINNCADIVNAVSGQQSVDISQHLIDTGVKRGDEFDVNGYFTVLTNLSMQAGYLLDYVYFSESLGGSPLLYARPESQAPYASMEDVPENTQLPDFREYLEVEDVKEGYFE